MPKFNDDISYPLKQNPVIQDSFLMTDSQNQKRTKTVKFEDVFEAIAEYFNNTDSPLSQNNVFRFVEFSILIGPRNGTIPNEIQIEQSILNRINDTFSSLSLTVLQTELIIFKVNIINSWDFATHQRKYFLPAPLGKGVYDPLSDHITAEQLEIAYIQNSSSGVTPPLVTNVPGMYVFNLGDITIHGLSIINFLNTIEVTNWPNGYDLSDENTIYFFNYELDNVEYLLFFDAEASANGNGFYGAQGDFLFSPSDLIELYDSENPQPVVVNAVPEAPNDGQIYGRKNLTWEPVSMTGNVGNINQVLLQGNEITSDTPIVYPDNGVTQTIYSNGFFELKDVGSGQRFMFSQGFISKFLQDSPNRFISLVFDDNLTGQTEYILTNEPGGLKIIASRDWVNNRGFELQSNKGAANGYTPLNASSKIDATYLPDSILGQVNYQGTWDASTNSPSIPSASSANKGYYYIVNIAGTTTINGINDWQIGDWIISNGTTWSKVDNTDAISSFNGRTGAITLVSSDVTSALGFTPENSANKATTMSGNTGSNTVFLSAKAVFDWVTGLLANATTAGITKLYNVLGENTDGAITQKAVKDALDTKVTLNNWIDISLTSTITGWASFTTRNIEYLIVGNEVSVRGLISGPSNSADTRITFPLIYTGTQPIGELSVSIVNNGTAQTAPGLARVLANTNEILFFTNGNLGAFSSSGTKQVNFNLKFKIN